MTMNFKFLLAAASIAALSGAGPASAAHHEKNEKAEASAPGVKSLKERLDGIYSNGRTRNKLKAQILLDRAGFSPGVIDGYGGDNTAAAVRAWQKANNREETGTIDDALIDQLRQADGGKYLQLVRVRQRDLDKSFDTIPEGMEAQAAKDSLGYESIEELLAERYHMDVDFLKELNPDKDFSKAGTPIIVARAGPAKLNESVARIEIDRSANWLRAYNGAGTMIASYPATVGSKTLPSPEGTHQVRAIAPQAKYYFDPDKNPWGPDKKLTLAAGPNNPVGGIWIDLTEDGYGIHGSPDPNLIGKTASHGCVRLTNWDARELADAVRSGETTVEFIG